MRVGLNVWNMLNTRQACRFLFIKTARICSNLLRANGQYVRYPSKENRKSSIVLWEMGRIVGNHMQQVNLLIPHKDIFESSVLFFYTGPTGLNVSTLSIVENKNSTQTSGLQWLWSSYAHVTLLFLIQLMRNWNVRNFKWPLEGWLKLIWSYMALISDNSLETLIMILCRTLFLRY